MSLTGGAARLSEFPSLNTGFTWPVHLYRGDQCSAELTALPSTRPYRAAASFSSSVAGLAG